MLLKASLNVLLEGVPEGIRLEQVETAIRGVRGVASVHDLHIWSISNGKASLTVHVVCEGATDEWSAVLREVRELLAARFDIHHTTVQVEPAPCEQQDDTHRYSANQHAHQAHGCGGHHHH